MTAQRIGRKRRRCRGQSTVETLLVLMFLCLVFFALVQVAYLYMGQLVAHHAAFVTGRSYIVGFEPDIVERASEVGTIGLAGHLIEPPALQNLSPAELGDIEPVLIGEFVRWRDYLMLYEHWPRVSERTPMFERDGMVPISVDVHDYPLQMPMRGAYMEDDTVDFGSRVELYNHAAYYLQ